MNNILNISTKQEFYDWLKDNFAKETCCFLKLKKGQPKDDNNFYYLDAVEIALCFGWIDSTIKPIGDTKYQRFTPRKNQSLWTELNKERVRRLEKLGLMTDAGRKVLPDMKIEKIVIPKDVKEELIKADALKNFNNFPELYKRVRLYNLNFYKTKLKNSYKKSLENFIKNTKNNKMYGEWNDYGRLLNY